MVAVRAPTTDRPDAVRMALTEIAVGVISRAHGIRGEVAVTLRTDEPERRFAPGTVLRAEPTRAPAARSPARPETGRPETGRPETGRREAGRTFTVVRTREHQGRWLVTFEEIGDRNAAEAARGLRLIADVAEDETPTGEDEYYDRQLIGLAVVSAARPDPIGTIAAVLHLPSQDMLEIDTDAGPRLVPFVSELVPTVDLTAGRITVADVAGLLFDEEGLEDGAPSGEDAT